MNILFIEDERALAETGILQFEQRGHRVFPARTVAEARELLSDSSNAIDCVIADHQLSDGFGIDFVIGAKAVNPNREYAVVSGYLNEKNIQQLEDHSILYFRKPLLYKHVLDQLRKKRINRREVEKQGPPKKVEDSICKPLPVDKALDKNSPNDLNHQNPPNNQGQIKTSKPQDNGTREKSLLKKIRRKLTASKNGQL